MLLTSIGKSKSKGALNRIDELEAEVVALSAENQQNLAKIAELFAENERLREDKALLLQPESLMAQFSTGDGSADVAKRAAAGGALRACQSRKATICCSS